MPPLTEESPPVKARVALTKWFKSAQDLGIVRSGIDAESVAIGLIGAIQTRTLRTRIMNDKLESTDETYLRSVIDVFCFGLEVLGEND